MIHRHFDRRVTGLWITLDDPAGMVINRVNFGTDSSTALSEQPQVNRPNRGGCDGRTEVSATAVTISPG